MTRVIWGKTGERFFEAGVDRGMLYVGAVGVAWPGLVSVEERPIGGTAKAYYYEGDKYANISSREEYEATIAAFSAPPEFAACDGTTQIANGLFLTQQPRTSFGFSYRTRVGNDVDAVDHGYKIHLVYNALAAPASRTNSTLTDASEATEMSWSITTLPPSLSGHRPTAHLVIDSRATDPRLLADLEDILYGSSFLMPRLPQPEEMALLFAQPALVGRWLGDVNVSHSELVNGRTGEALRANLFRNPRAVSSQGWGSSAGTGGTVSRAVVAGAEDGPTLDTGETMATYLRTTWTAASTGGIHEVYTIPPVEFTQALPIQPPGTIVHAIAWCRVLGFTGVSVQIAAHLRRQDTGTTAAPLTSPFTPFTPGEWLRLELDSVVPESITAPVSSSRLGVALSAGAMPVGGTIDVVGLLYEFGTTGPYFDGSTFIQ